MAAETQQPRRAPRAVRLAAQVVAGAAAVGIVGFAFADAASGGSSHDARNNLTIIAPAGAGGGWDSAAREAQQAIRANGIANNTQVVNIPGAGGTIGLSELNQMAGESSTLMMMGITMLGATHVNGSDVSLDQVTPIARLTDDYDVVVVPAASDIETLDDLMEQWGADPERFPFGGGSLGSVDQMIITQLAGEEGLDPTAVNYIAYSGGGELAVSLLSGTIKASVSGYQDFSDQIAAGNLRVLAVSAPDPVPEIDAPTLIEQGYDVSLTNWRGLVAPPGITDAERTELEAIAAEFIDTPEWRDALQRNQWTDTSLIGADFATNLADETELVDGIWADLGY
ncbi:Bug family tripartite tricarboxylate transporter substrate binding protein [Promicromonospora sukumoe]|uniref:Bug family tripartite tricarboxylate transporter substrate binding protein n=1 Tax=Promicromonospora sukumoe TaxID=88382 RepID=UPI0036636507